MTKKVKIIIMILLTLKRLNKVSSNHAFNLQLIASSLEEASSASDQVGSFPLSPPQSGKLLSSFLYLIDKKLLIVSNVPLTRSMRRALESAATPSDETQVEGQHGKLIWVLTHNHLSDSIMRKFYFFPGKILWEENK